MQPFEQVLELDKVLARAAEFTSNETSRRMMLATKPSSDLAEVQQEIQKTDDALQLAMQFGTPPFSGFKDICGMVTRAASGARLSLRDLLDVADLLRQVQGMEHIGHAAFVKLARVGLIGKAQGLVGILRIDHDTFPSSAWSNSNRASLMVNTS